MAGSPDPSRSTLLATASSVIDGYNAWTLPAILAPRSPTCIHSIQPSSLTIPPMNNVQYAEHVTPRLSIFRKFKLTVHESIVDVEARKVVMMASSTADTDIGPYQNEYVAVVEMTEAGTKAEKVIEWVDSGHSQRFMEMLMKFTERENKQGEEGGEERL